VISMPQAQFEDILEAAATRGAKKALAAVGLEDEMAPDDIRGLRDLFSIYRVVRTGFFKQIGSAVAIVVLGGLSLAFWAKFGSGKGLQ